MKRMTLTVSISTLRRQGGISGRTSNIPNRNPFLWPVFDFENIIFRFGKAFSLPLPSTYIFTLLSSLLSSTRVCFLAI